MRFLLSHFGAIDLEHHMLRDRELDNPITEASWRSHVYPGMIIEAEGVGGLEDGAEKPAESPRINRHPTTCQLCRKTLYSQAALGRHVKSHLQRRPCPTPCSICSQSPASSWTCKPGCLCSPNHGSYIGKASNTQYVGDVVLFHA